MHCRLLIRIVSIVACRCCAYGYAPPPPANDVRGEHQDFAFAEKSISESPAIAPLAVLLISAHLPASAWMPISMRSMSKTKMPLAQGRSSLLSRRLQGPIQALAGNESKVDMKESLATKAKDLLKQRIDFEELKTFGEEFTEFATKGKEWDAETLITRQRSLVEKYFTIFVPGSVFALTELSFFFTSWFLVYLVLKFSGYTYDQIVEIIAGVLPFLRDALGKVPTNLGNAALSWFVADNLIPVTAPLVIALTPGLTEKLKEKLVDWDLDAKGVNKKLEQFTGYTPPKKILKNPKPVKFSIKIVKNSGDGVGLDVDWASSQTIRILEVMEKGMFQTWNEENPSQCVEVDDRIVEINGKSGDSKALLDLLKYSSEMTIAIEGEREDEEMQSSTAGLDSAPVS